jgi:predicted dehydrogenase
METMGKRIGMNRRQFLGRTALAAGAFALPTIIPSSALGKDGGVAPSERIVMGCIGMGGMGTGDMRAFMSNPDVQIVAVCDVDHRQLGPVSREVNEYYGFEGNCDTYRDFRELLAHEGIDAVSVTTPDHWHALASVAALNAGKDVYCEKPLANSVYEGRAICNAAIRNNRVLQTGSHERSTDSIRFACELVRNGRIGTLRRMRVNLPCSDGHHQEARALTEVPPPEPVPEGFDYDFWLGHTHKVPYTSRRCHFWWRFILSYGGGEMTDRGAHVIDIAQLGAGMDHTTPVHYEARGVQTPGSLYNAFWDYSFVNTYANGVELIGSTAEPRGVKFEGDEGWVFVHIHGGALEAEPQSLLSEGIGADEIHLGRSPGHQRNFLDCVRSREAPMAPAEVGHHTATICHLNNIAMRMGSVGGAGAEPFTLEWDPDRERITNSREANRLLTPTMRAPWSL